jgi:hypothetical protein
METVKRRNGSPKTGFYNKMLIALLRFIVATFALNNTVLKVLLSRPGFDKRIKLT